ncbi:hypothetical protein HAX54_011837, partial [Datura stramonium]|nr:hypothetical protein [Datura stramonium]
SVDNSKLNRDKFQSKEGVRVMEPRLRKELGVVHLVKFKRRSKTVPAPHQPLRCVATTPHRGPRVMKPYLRYELRVM